MSIEELSRMVAEVLEPNMVHPSPPALSIGLSGAQGHIFQSPKRAYFAIIEGGKSIWKPISITSPDVAIRLVKELVANCRGAITMLKAPNGEIYCVGFGSEPTECQGSIEVAIALAWLRMKGVEINA